MIELPEAVTIARQMTAELSGKRIESAVRGNAPHKFAFYSREPEEYESILKGRTVGESAERGSQIVARVEPGYALVLGGGGERILHHQSDTTLPKKHQLLLRFEDGTWLSVSVQGWGYVQLVDQMEIGPRRVSPLEDAFTLDWFKHRFEEVPEGDPRSIKFFMISQPGVWGVGNGYLQDILFRAKVHPRRRVKAMTAEEMARVHAATRAVMREATDLGGRDTERDLHNQPGGYHRILSSQAVGQPCPDCGTPVEKMQYLGGAAYFCPTCQVL